MTQHDQNSFENVIAFAPAVARAHFWAASRLFGVSGGTSNANENHAPSMCKGAQTSDLMLDFLYGVTRQAN